MHKLRIFKLAISIALVGMVAIVGFKVIMNGSDNATEICQEIADESFKETHGRLPDSEDFISDEVIQSDWYPVFQKCLESDQ